MTPHIVKLGVIPTLSIECKFWLDDDGWMGTAEEFRITVHAPSFEAAKTAIELALGRHIKQALRASGTRNGSAA